MKKSIYLSALAGLAVFASCSNNDEPTRVFLNGELQVTASIDQIKTRYSDTAFATNDEIGISGGDYSNVKFSTSDGVAFSAATDKIMIADNATVSFTAYAPYSADGGTITFTEPADYLFADAKDASYSNPKVTFDFKHVMSKISLTLNPGEGETAKGIKVTLSDVVKGGSFNTVTGAITPSETKGNVSKESSDNTAAIILPPSTAAQEAKLSLTFNEKSYSGTLNIPAMTAGYQYNYTITIKPGETTEATSEFVAENPTVTGWTANEQPSFTVEEDEDMITEVGDYLLKDGSVMDKNSPRFNDKKSDIVGVVFYVGNPQPSALYGYNANIDVLKTDFPDCTTGLAIAINDANDGTPARFATAKYTFSDVFKESADNYDADMAAKYISTNLNLTSVGERMLGYNNTEFVQVCAEKFGDDNTATGVAEFLDILKAYNTANTVTGATSWYLPSYAEMNVVIENYAVVKASVEKAGGSLESFSDFGDTNTETFYWTSDFRGNSYNWVSPMTTVAEGVNLYLGRNSNSTKGYFRFAIAF